MSIIICCDNIAFELESYEAAITVESGCIGDISALCLPNWHSMCLLKIALVAKDYRDTCDFIWHYHIHCPPSGIFLD